MVKKTINWVNKNFFEKFKNNACIPKRFHVSVSYTHLEEGIIIGADTVVSIDGKILGKPADTEEAREMIYKLQGKSHMVYTGVTVIAKSGDMVSASSFAEGTKVNVAPMTENEIEAYISTDEPYDKAGAYGIQGLFGKFIEGIKGDYFNVVGLPVHRLYEELKKFD